MVSDPLALQHILNNGEFEFAPIFDTLFRWLFGERNMAVLKGVLQSTTIYYLCYRSSAGNEHRSLRTAWNAAFTAGAVRQYQPILEKVAQGVSTISNFQTNSHSKLELHRCEAERLQTEDFSREEICRTTLRASSSINGYRA
jgi:cytochrome P450